MRGDAGRLLTASENFHQKNKTWHTVRPSATWTGRSLHGAILSCCPLTGTLSGGSDSCKATLSATARVAIQIVAGAKRYSLQEHLAPEMVFSSGAFSHVQWSAASLPQEHLACLAQQHPASPEMLQQVDGCIFAVLFNSMALRFESAVSFQGVTMCV